MNTNKVYLLVMFILAENIQKDVLANSSIIKPVTFYENTKSLHIIFNKLFTSLKLKDSFSKTTKIRLLLTIHKCLLKIIKGKHYKHREINAETGITTIKDDSNKNVLFEILQDNTIFLENCTMKDIDNDVYERLIESIKQFLYKIDKLNSGFEKNVVGEKDIDKYRTLDNITKLKVWVPNKNQSSRRIFNSRTTRINWYSFMVSVHVNDEFICAGAIIKNHFVITAASCLYNLLKDRKDVDLSVRVGSEFTASGGVLVAIIEVYLHYQFNPKTLENNLAILRMNHKIKTAKKRKKIRKIAYSKEDVTITSSIFMLGWGAKTETNEQLKFQKLSYAYVDMYDLEKCKRIYSGVHVNDNNFCTGLEAKGSGACGKDIGDPAIVDGMLVGVVSFGPPLCGTPDAPTVFTKISHYTQWIESIVNKNKPNLRPALRAPKTVTRLYPMQLHALKTVSTLYPMQRVGNFHHIKPVSDYPEEIMILREILEDLEMTNGSLIDEVIDESFDKEILDSLIDTTKTDLVHHPLINKSIVPIHGVHIPEEKSVEEEYHPVSLTTSNLFTYLWQKEEVTIPDRILNYGDYVGEYENFKTITFFTTTAPRVTTKRYSTTTAPLDFIFGRGTNKDEDSSESTSSDVESKGLSIEKTTAKIFDEPSISSSQESQTKTLTEADSHLLFDVDSDFQYNQKKRHLTKKDKRYQNKVKKVPLHRDFQFYTKMLPEGSFEFDYTLDISIEKK